ncbi:triphosphoribosyl-dephospho-CoA synthase [Pelomonas sp. KK5]|uniref:triphosphoribosyl-dephospho-CoA synthase n=1 Tax=Pelomonas sp. KK5 TaxID=1855730 RepID=UPI00097C8CE6|nr:triphosphoribosyl-dephospho-CoA synthase [Pelomonas sp. KK5]
MNMKQAFLQACALDVAVRKPGNVSLHSPGHGMQAQQFLDSAAAAAGPLCQAGARVGERIEGAVRATRAAAGCNTNLGILLLAAPIAMAMERSGEASAPALEAVLAALDVDDARAAYRGIALAHPGGLGDAAEQDVNAAPPSIDLRAAMVLAAERDRIARQYRDGYAELLAMRLPPEASPDAADVQRLYLGLLASDLDSHIVRKHGTAVAQTVMAAAQRWRERAAAGEALDASPAFAAWDEALKSRGINPGTSADLTVAVLILSALPRGGTDRDN